MQAVERAAQIGQNLLRSGLSDYKSVDERMEEARQMQVTFRACMHDAGDILRCEYAMHVWYAWAQYIWTMQHVAT